MAQVNISQAARLVGKSRTTIHRKINKGELSIQSGLVDTSELIRVFGALVSESEQSSTGVTRSKVVTSEQVTVQQQVQLEVLQAKFESLQKELALKDEIIQEKDKRLALLEHNPTTTDKPSSTDHPSSPQAKNYHPSDYDNVRHSEYTHTPEREKLKEERKSEGRVIKLARFLFDT